VRKRRRKQEGRRKEGAIDREKERGERSRKETEVT
jgi:hypothetical protein